MLYKKYHRNFIREFKEGVRFKYLRRENYYSSSIVDKIAISFYGNIYVTNGYSSWDLVYSGGKINKHIDVIQEIS